MSEGEEVAEDYAVTRHSLRRHPVSFLRADLAAKGLLSAADLWDAAPGRRVRVAGLVTIRQRPSTARGVIFVTIEDETGVANLIVRRHVVERFRRPLLGAVLLAAAGTLERDGLVQHVLVDHLADLTPDLRALTAPETPHPPVIDEPVLEATSRDFR